MTDAHAVLSNEQPKRKKSIFKRWWFWLLAIVVIVILISALSSGSSSPSTIYELSKMQTMSKQQIIDKFGNPDETVRDDSEGYIYGYNDGFMVSGTAEGATEVTLQEDMIKNGSADSYKIFDATLGSSFDENIERLGKPNLSQLKDGKKSALYLTNEDFLLRISSGFNSDKIAAIQYSDYASSEEALALDLSRMLGLSASEEEISALYTIKDKSSQNGETLYDLDGLQMIVNDKDLIVKQLILSSDSIYNLHGIRTGNTLEKANKLFGKPVNTSEGVKDTTQYTYQYDGGATPTVVNLSVQNKDQRIGYIEVSLQD